MRFQIQWAGGAHLSTEVVAGGQPVTVEQAVGALVVALGKVRDRAVRAAATPAVIRQVSWLFRLPPNGLVQGGNVNTEVFGLPGDPTARVDVEKADRSNKLPCVRFSLAFRGIRTSRPNPQSKRLRSAGRR
jgi:hypothetical protein